MITNESWSIKQPDYWCVDYEAYAQSFEPEDIIPRDEAVQQRIPQRFPTVKKLFVSLDAKRQEDAWTPRIPLNMVGRVVIRPWIHALQYCVDPGFVRAFQVQGTISEDALFKLRLMNRELLEVLVRARYFDCREIVGIDFGASDHM